THHKPACHFYQNENQNDLTHNAKRLRIVQHVRNVLLKEDGSMIRQAASDVRKDFAEALNRVAFGGERIVLHRRGKDVAVLVPIADLELLEQIEDVLDAREAVRRISDPNEIPVPYETARKALGMD
ncbi:MAG: type II toxin-antitoxin system Phd/YefM family antitoxin, partial [Desulfocapsaceae bacterium]|nr:type II toxin-antitoxin system Phd/YefM family antitoxin [Desulfocapsaceae bacterium]